MRKKYQMACAVAVITLPVLTIMRIMAQPRVVAGSVRVGLDFLLLALTVGVLLVVLLSAVGKKKQSCVLKKSSASVASVGMVAAGVFMMVSAGGTLLSWLLNGTMPYPVRTMPTDIDVTLLYLLVLTGAGGGAFLLLTGYRWFVGRQALRGIHRLAALLPVVWIWVRIARYEMSHISSLSVFRNIYDLLMLMVEMLFLFSLAKYVAGVQETMPRSLVGLSLGAAILATMSWAVRVAMLIAQNQEAFDTCGLGTTADLGIAVLGFLLAFAYAGGARENEERLSEETSSVAEDAPEEVWPLLTSEDLLLGMDVDDENLSEKNEEVRRPLELDDIINDIIFRHQGGKK